MQRIAAVLAQAVAKKRPKMATTVGLMPRCQAGNITESEHAVDRIVATQSELPALRRKLRVRRERGPLLVRRRNLSPADAHDRRSGLPLPGLPARPRPATFCECRSMTMRHMPAVLAAMLFTAAPCGAQQQSLTGTWEVI